MRTHEYVLNLISTWEVAVHWLYVGKANFDIWYHNTLQVLIGTYMSISIRMYKNI